MSPTNQLQFKDFFHQAEGDPLHEREFLKKSGRFLGGLAGMAAPVAGAALASNAIAPDFLKLAGSDIQVPDDPTGQGGLGGLLGMSMMRRGHNAGAAIGGAIGDKVGHGIDTAAKWAWDKLRGKKKGDPNKYFDKLTGGDKDLNPDDVQVRDRLTPEPAATTRDAKDAVKQFQATSPTKSADMLRLVLRKAGYSGQEALRLGFNQDVVKAWDMNGLPGMIQQELDAGRHGTAKHIALTGVAKLQDAGLLPKPAEQAPPETGDETSGPGWELVPDDEVETSGKKQLDLFGDEVVDKPKKRRKPAGPREKKPYVSKDTPSMFPDEPEPLDEPMSRIPAHELPAPVPAKTARKRAKVEAPGLF